MRNRQLEAIEFEIAIVMRRGYARHTAKNGKSFERTAKILTFDNTFRSEPYRLRLTGYGDSD